MFEINVNVKVETDPANKLITGKCSVENIITLNGKEQGKMSVKEFENPLEAYIFVSDYFYSMVEELTLRSGMMGSILDTLKKPEVN